jgi:uncharacterized membrane protein
MKMWAYLTGAALILAGAIILWFKDAHKTALYLGTGFFVLFVAFHLSHQLLFPPAAFYVASWSNPLKELTFSGGAFVLAGSYFNNQSNTAGPRDEALLKILSRIGQIFFSIMLIVFGIDHLLYTEFVAALVPAWIPFHIFWTYFASVALIGAGVCIIFKIKVRLVCVLLGIMLFAWFIVLHIPGLLPIRIRKKEMKLPVYLKPWHLAG